MNNGLLKLTTIIILFFAMLLLSSCNTQNDPGLELIDSVVLDGMYSNEIQFSSTEDILGIASTNGLHIYQLDGLAELWSSTLEGNVISLSFSHDGTTVAYLAANEIILADAKTGETVQTLVTGLENATDIKNLEFNPDDSLLAAVVRPAPGEPTVVMIWNLETGEIVHTLLPEEVLTAPEGMAWGFMDMDFSPDGHQLATGLFGSSVIVWDVDTGARLQDLQDLENAFGTIDSLDWHPEDPLIATGHRGDGNIAFWDPNTGKLLKVIEVSLNSNNPCYPKLKWSPSGDILAVAPSAYQVQLRDPDGNLLFTYETEGEFVNSIDWSSDGDYLVAYDNSSKLYIWKYTD